MASQPLKPRRRTIPDGFVDAIGLDDEAVAFTPYVIEPKAVAPTTGKNAKPGVTDVIARLTAMKSRFEEIKTRRSRAGVKVAKAGRKSAKSAGKKVKKTKSATSKSDATPTAPAPAMRIYEYEK
ncbi:MAG: hypothetical protein P4L99_02930 [Chthoniobacter sp.]|nr:hypothetical protein [Chthoniobacter sp.]